MLFIDFIVYLHSFYLHVIYFLSMIKFEIAITFLFALQVT